MDDLLSAAVGLARALDTVPDAEGMRVLCAALHSKGADAPERLRTEKWRISPDCRTCAAPCGRKADYDETQAAQDTPETREAKRAAWEALLRYVRSRSPAQCDAEAVLRLVFYLGESWVAPEDLTRCLQRLTQTPI